MHASGKVFVARKSCTLTRMAPRGLSHARFWSRLPGGLSHTPYWSRLPAALEHAPTQGSSRVIPSSRAEYIFLGKYMLLENRALSHAGPLEGCPMPVLGAVCLFLSTFGENCPRFPTQLSFDVGLTGPGWVGRSVALWGRNTRQEDVEESPTQSRISPSIQRILR